MGVAEGHNGRQRRGDHAAERIIFVGRCRQARRREKFHADNLPVGLCPQAVGDAAGIIYEIDRHIIVADYQIIVFGII